MLGAFFGLLAYFLLQSGRLKSGDIKFNSLNLLCALFIIISLTHDWNLAAFIIEAFWAAIAIYGLLRKIRGTKNG